MNSKVSTLNKVLLSIVLILLIALLSVLLYWIPKISETTLKLNNAKCLESYYNQGQAPMGACGYDF